MYTSQTANSERTQQTNLPFEYDYEKRVSFHIVPKWIFDSFRTHNNLVDIRSYPVLRASTSNVDLAHLEILSTALLQKVFPGGKPYIYVDPLFSEEDMSVEEATDYRSTVLYLSNMASEQESVMNRLEGAVKNGLEEVEEDRTDANLKPYSIVVDQRSIFIVVDEGFTQHMGVEANRLSFLTQVLKSAYGIASVSEVHASFFYRLYLDALAGRR